MTVIGAVSLIVTTAINKSLAGRLNANQKTSRIWLIKISTLGNG
jgi:hypothetical protein